MTAQPDTPGPDTGSYEVIHLGAGRPRSWCPWPTSCACAPWSRPPTPEDLEDAEDTAAVLEWKGRDAAGQTTFVPASEATGAGYSGGI